MKAPAAIEHRCGAPDLLVMLPGALMTPQHMADAGLFDAVQARDLALDLVAVDLQALQACNREALQTLDRAVLAPARSRYRRVWLGGISRGGQLALSYLAEGMGAVQGLCLLAPYPGSRLTLNAVQRAGGLAAWQATAEQWCDPEFRLWHWLKQPAWPATVFMGWGAQDRFADGMGQLAARLPPATAAVQVPGAHDWQAWRALWDRFLDLGLFRASP